MHKINKKKITKITTKREFTEREVTPSPKSNKIKFKKCCKVWVKTKSKEFKEIIKSARSNKYSTPTYPSSRHHSEDKRLRINAQVNSSDQFDYTP